ncbi:MAG: TolC family protein, partial [Proteobacteria bacterium]|nr:TolC family protein [Pseudomonadota bacterium]
FLRYGVTFRQSLTDFGRTRARIGSAEAQRMVSEGRLEEAANATALDFLQSYIALLQAEKNLEVTLQEIRMFEAHLSDARALYEAGEVTRSDILYAEVNLAEGTLKNLIAQDNLEVAASRVNFFVLRPLDRPLEVFQFPPPFTGIPEVDDLVKEAQANRPELRILNDKVAFLESQAALQKREHYPRLFAGGGYSYEENPYRVHEDNWSVVLGMTWDLYSGGAVSAAGEKARRDLLAVLTEREKIRTSISLQVREELQRLRGAVSRVDVASRALLQAEENLRLSREKYHEGEASATEVTDAVTALTRAGNNHWAAVYDRMRAQARILYATGSDLAAAYRAASAGVPADIGNKTDEKQGE